MGNRSENQEPRNTDSPDRSYPRNHSLLPPCSPVYDHFVNFYKSASAFIFAVSKGHSYLSFVFKMLAKSICKCLN